MRALASAGVLAAGFGLVGLASCSLAANLALFAGYWTLLKRALPELHLSPGLVQVKMLKEAASYGFHTTVAGAGSALLEQTPPVLFGKALSASAVGYYTLPLRMLQYPAELMTRPT